MKFLLLVFFGSPLILFSQFNSHPKFGWQAGVVFAVGSHQQKIGLSGNIFYHDLFYQFNLGSQFSFLLNSYGGRKGFWENRTDLGLVLLAGKKNLRASPIFGGLQHQTNYNYGLAYNYLLYRDNKGTSQWSGGFGLHIKEFFIAMENDIFAGGGRDRFRTAILYAHFRQEFFTYFTEVFLWTGETRNSIWNKTSTKRMPYGYKDLSNLPYGKTSHGIWSFGIHASLPYRQIFTAKFGIDGEKIRNFVQNKLGHDLIFLPKKFKRNTPHYPMLDTDGNPILSKEQNKKRTKPFLSISTNNYLFD